MERKFWGFLLTAIGVVGLVMADVNLMQLISSPAYGNNIYTDGDRNSPAMAVMGYGLLGLILIFLGIKMLRRRTSM